MKNIKLGSGRICSKNMETSFMVSNKNKSKLVDNIEEGVKKLAVKLIQEGIDLISSCQGHPPTECEFNTRNIKICVEQGVGKKIIENIKEVNKDHNTQIDYIEDEDEINENWDDLKRLLSKEYEKPVIIYIILGYYADSERNYEILVENFDNYEWK